MSNIEAYRQALARIKANDKLNSNENVYTPEITNNSTTESYNNAMARTAGTALKVVDNVGTGVVKGLEGIVDFGAALVGNIGGLFSDSFEDNVSDFINTDYTSKIKNTITGGANSGYNKLVNSSYTNELPDVAQSIFDGVTQGVGQMLPSIALTIATGGAGAVALGTMGAAAAGNSTESALQEGHDLGKASLYGLGSGAVEIGTELIGGKLFDSKILGVFGGSADDIGKATTKSLVKSIAKESFGEGAEEVLGDFVTPLLEKATIKSDDKLSDLYQDSIKSMPMDFIVGALTGSVMNGISTNSRARKYGTANANVPNIVSEAHDIFKEMNTLEKSGKLTKEKTTEFQDRLKTLENAYEEALGRDVSEKQLNNAKAFESTMEGASNYSPKESLIKDLVNSGSNNLNVEFKSNEEIQTELIDKGAKKETINGVDGYTTGDGRFIVSSDTTNNTYSIATHEALHNLPSEERTTIQQEAVKALDKKSFKKTINGVETEITKDNWEQVYSELYPELSKESLVEEMTNDYVGSMSTDYKSFKNGKETKLINVETVTAKLKNKVKQLVLDNKQKDIYNKELYKTRKKLEDLSENLKRKNKVDVGGTIIYKEFEPFLEPLSKLSVSVNGYGMDAFKENIEAFKEALEKTNVLSPEIKSTLLPIADSFDFRKDKVTGKYIKRKLSGDELKNINKLVDSINKFNREYDEVVLGDKTAKASECVQEIMDDTKDNYDKMAKGSAIRKLTGGIRKAFNSIVDPRTRFKLLENKSNGFLSTKLMNTLVSAENRVSDNLYKLRSGINEFLKNDKSKTLKKLQEKHKIGEMDLTNSQFVSLYMTLKNEDGYARLVSTEESDGNGFVIKVNETKKTFKPMTESEASEVIDYVETEFADFLKPLKELWYNTAGQMYSDTLNERFGFTYENRKNYFHMNVDEGNFSETIGDTESMYKNMENMFRPSFSKKIQNNKHSLYIEDIITSTNKFTSQLATFAGFSPAIDNVNKILRRPVAVNGQTITTLEYLKTHVDKDLPVYLRNLLLNAQGLRGANQKAPSPTLSKVRGNLAKFALGANVKVMLTQTTSYAMAFGELRASSLARGLTMPSGNKTLALMIDNSPYFRNRFENNEATKAITLDSTASNLLNKGTNLTTKGIGFMDKQTIMRIFNASIVEIAKNNGVSINEVKTNKELLKKAIDKAEDVTRKTQPQYSALENGSITQSGDIMKSFLMYTSVSRKFLSQFISKAHDAFHGGSKGIFLKTAAGLLASQTLLSLLSQMFKQFLGKDDDDKVFDSDLLKETLENSTVNLIPVVKDIYNKFANGYDLDVNVLSMANDTIDTISNVDNLFGTPAERTKYLYSMTNVVGQLTGIPTKNITEYTTSLFGTTFNADWAIKSRNALYGVGNSTLKNNIALDYKKGNLSIARANLSNYFLNAGMSELNTKSSNEVARLISLGYTNVLPTTNLSSMTINGVSYSLKPKVQAKFAKVYSEAQGEVDSFISSKEYKELDDENKARFIKKIYQAYYNVAKYEVVSDTVELSAFELALTDISASKLTSILAHCSTLNSTQVKAYISRYNSKIQQHILDILG